MSHFEKIGHNEKMNHFEKISDSEINKFEKMGYFDNWVNSKLITPKKIVT